MPVPLPTDDPRGFEGALADVRRRVRTAIDAGPSPHLEGIRYEDCIETRAQFCASVGLAAAVPALLLLFLFTQGPILWVAAAVVAAAAAYVRVAFVRIRDGRARLYRDGVVVPAALVWAASLAPESDEVVPAVLVATFHEPLAADPDGLVALAEHLATDPAVASALGGDALLAPRVPVPPPIAGNDRTFLIRVGINRYEFPDERFDRRLVFLLARDDANGPRDAIFLLSIFWGVFGAAWTANYPIARGENALEEEEDDDDWDDDERAEDDGADAMWSSEPPAECPAFEALCESVRRRYRPMRDKLPPPGFASDDHWDLWHALLFLFGMLWALPLAIVAWFVAPIPVFAVIALIAVVSIAVALRFNARAERPDRTLFSKGVIVPAAVVQANSGLFDEDDEDDLPGSMLVSFDPYFARHPAALVRLASSVFSWKNAPLDQLPPDARRIGWDLRTELGGLPPRPVAPAIGGRPDTWLVDVLFRRDTLPNRCIDRRIFLVLARRDAPQPAHLIPTDLWLDDDSDRLTQSITEA